MLPAFGYQIALSIIKSVHIQANTFVCVKSPTRKVLASREKLCPWLSLLINIKSWYKQTGVCFVDCFNPPQKNLSVEKCYTDERIAITIL